MKINKTLWFLSLVLLVNLTSGCKNLTSNRKQHKLDYLKNKENAENTLNNRPLEVPPHYLLEELPVDIRERQDEPTKD